MKYTAKSLCEFLNTNRETLRHYEKMGLIHPEIDMKNHYRYYNDLDVETIAECRKYRSLDFSIKEIKKIKNVDKLSSYTSIIEEKQKYYEKQSIYYKKLAIKNKANLEMLHSINNIKNQFKIEEMDDIYLSLAFDNINDFDENKNKYANFASMLLNDFAFADFSILINMKDFILKKKNYIGGTSFTYDWVKFLNISVDNMMHIKKEKTITTIITINEDLTFNYEEFNDILEYIENKNIKINGDIFITQIAKITHINSKTRYFKVWVPILE
ncbi:MULTISPECIES: MerR family transcriptional regulator [unclassified Clostridium]|uniref:MerR family transcriptional regulator n=1 Tax=unclassified Clostridium TaxID=2614128 RepID=UPI001EEEEDD0|nr:MULTISPECIES: MerR family transcriptional regulator [unclassified Clostridium]